MIGVIYQINVMDGIMQFVIENLLELCYNFQTWKISVNKLLLMNIKGRLNQSPKVNQKYGGFSAEQIIILI